MGPVMFPVRGGGREGMELEEVEGRWGRLLAAGQPLLPLFHRITFSPSMTRKSRSELHFPSLGPRFPSEQDRTLPRRDLICRQ